MRNGEGSRAVAWFFLAMGNGEGSRGVSCTEGRFGSEVGCRPITDRDHASGLRYFPPRRCLPYCPNLTHPHLRRAHRC